MDKIAVKGGRRLEGNVTVSGAKNAALPAMAASLLADGPTRLKGVPDLMDIRTMAKLLSELGVGVVREESGDLVLTPENPSSVCAPYEIMRTMRAGICVLGPLLAKRGRAEVSLPGGCNIGDRPVDLHIKGMQALGANVEIEHGYIMASAKRLHAEELYLGGPFGSTVLGTANVMMAATLSRGTTIIESAAAEPEVQDLGHMLVKMGARINGIGTSRLTIEGVEELKPVEHTVIGDRIEAGTFMAAAVITGGDITIDGTHWDHLLAVIHKLRQIGADIRHTDGRIRIRGSRRLHSVDLTTLPFPGFPTDLQAQVMAILSVADGISIVTEKIFPDRFMHVAEMNRMGARIRKEGSAAIVMGVDTLSGAPVMASDLRASAALIVAALVARGETVVDRVYHLDRGYEGLEGKLSNLGADIRRIT